MSMSESEYFDTGMSLPPDVRRHVALRLLESVDSDEAFGLAAESWLHSEVGAAHDALRADASRAIPHSDVREHFTHKWAAR